MQKLKLDLADLEVQSFPTAESPAGREGTVHGMIVSTDQVPHCQQEPGTGYAVAMGVSFGCPVPVVQTGDLACVDPANPYPIAADPGAAYPVEAA